MDQYIGKLLDNRYELLERSGSGGMAVVYKARCHRLNRLVAVKILKPDLANDAEFRRRFNDESQAVAMLSHPNIVAVYDVSRSDDLDYIVMELIDGITLKQYMQKRGVPLNWREALHFITQIVKALGHAHSRGIIHRDIKPQNIMVLRDGSIKVADFGIARLTSAGHSTLTQEALGSVHYISPEQARGSRIDGRSDLYSAGVVLYEMITGRLPFEGETPVSVAIQHINSIPIAPRALNPEIPEALEAITMKAMAPNVDQRYASADEMLADLEEFRKNPNISFEYTPADFDVMDDENEPTQIVPPHRRADDSISRRPQQRQNTQQHQNSQQRQNQSTQQSSRRREPDDREEERRGGIPPALIAAAVILLFVAGVGVFLWQFFFSPLFTTPTTHRVPNLIDMTLEEIQQDQEVMGTFEIVVGEPKYDENYDLNKIVGQSPTADTMVRDGDTTITVNINTEMEEQPSEQPEERTMPNVINSEQRQALQLLRDEMGLSVKREYESSDTVNQNYVIRTEPIAGEPLEEGGEVTLYISQGPEAEPPVTVPLVEGRDLEEATRILTDYNLNVGNISHVPSDTVESGLVVLQSIKASTEVPAGTRVNLQVSEGPDDTGEEPQPSESAEPSESPEVSEPPAPPEHSEPPESPAVSEPPSEQPVSSPTSDVPDEPDVPATVTTTQAVTFPLSSYTEPIQLRVYVGGQMIYNGMVDPAIGIWSATVTQSGVQTVEFYVNGVLERTETVDFSS